MIETKWTEEQLRAITERGCNLLVAAAAGAGKTAVLVERIIRKITDEENPVDIDKMLVVTFTNAAAAEMRERIGDAIEKALEKNPGSRKLQSQLTLLNKASITTIHSFCLEVIKNNFHCIDLDPNFRIADETEMLLIKTEALEELFEEKYEAENLSEEFLKLVECYGGSRDDRMLQDMVLTLYEFVQSHPWPKKWLEENTEIFNLPVGEDFGSTLWAEILIENVKMELSGLLKIMQKAVNIIQNAYGLEPYLPTFYDDISNMKVLLKNCDGSWDQLYDAFSALEFGRLSSKCPEDRNKVKQEQVKAMRNGVKEKLRKIKKEIFLSRSSEIIDDLNNLYPLVSCLSQLVMEFEEKYTVKKREKSLLDFNDLEHMCLEILIETNDKGDIMPSQVAQALRERFEEILMDEYQDSNLVQEVILNTISRKDMGQPNVFVVGDVKQSIYRFRQARPELFLEKYNTYSDELDSKDRKIQLYKNFRSRKEVIDGVNFIFKQIMSRNIGELDYDDSEALNRGSDYALLDEHDGIAGGPVELHIIDLKDEENGTGIPGDGEEQEEQPHAVQSEARIVAKRIKELTGSSASGKPFKVYDKSLKAYRPVEYRDIVILLRTTKNWADTFMGELNIQGIPSYADTATGFFKTVEVQIIMSLLQIIDNPIQDIPLLSVLRSPIGAFSSDELINIRLCDRKVSFYEAMKKQAEEGDNQTAEKVIKFLHDLDGWRDKALHMSTDELIWYLYTDTGYYSYAGAMPGGVQRQANLRMLFEKARQYEETSYKGLFNFINFINKLKANSGDMGSAKILGENENVVRIMSIHKSKGLEFPVVIVAGCGKRFNMQDTTRRILLHQDLGFGPDFVDYEKRIAYPTVPKQALKYKIKLETLSEEMRILYVAFTRVKEKLIITGSVRDIGKAVNGWYSCLDTGDIKLPEYRILNAKNYLDWIGPALIRHGDCSLLRKSAAVDEGYEETLLEDDSVWEVRSWNKGDILTVEVEAEQKEEDFLCKLKELKLDNPDSEYSEEIVKRLDWEYQYRMSGKLPAKVSVTELKRRSNTEFSEEYAPSLVYMPPLVKKPTFLEETKGLNAAERGTVLHFVMQHLDLKKVSTPQEIKTQVDEMIVNELLTEQEAKTVDINRIDKFFRSPLGQRSLRTNSVNREVPFNIELKSTEIYKDLPEEIYGKETVLLQGVIDCYFEENGDIVLVDYKTDYVPDGEIELIKEKYRVQIEHYTRALERITGRKVKEKYIYLFRNGEMIEY